MQNPWRGLAAYHEPKETDSYSYKFCGRNAAIKDLVALIETNLYVTMYGRTGIGKTSLLKAGVFPLLRKHNYIPVVVRFCMMDSLRERSFAEYIVECVEQEVDKNDDIAILTDDGNAFDFLWEYFATRHFYKDGQKVYPLIVLDQFEENFKINKKATWYLLGQLYSLINDNKIFPEGYHDETNFRIVISIREDDLFRLEDCIDQDHLNDLKFNRYRLVQPTEIEATEIVSIPGENCLPNNELEREEIIGEIIKTVKRGNDGNINTLILSLICSILFDKVIAEKRTYITLDDVIGLGNSPLTDFYISINLSDKTKAFIENRLIDSDGRRNTVNVEEIEKQLPEWISLKDTELVGIKNNRILQESNGKVELIHDMFAKAVKEVRDSHQQELEKIKKRQQDILSSFIIIGTFILFVFQLLELENEPFSNIVRNILFKGDFSLSNTKMLFFLVLNFINIINLLLLGYGVVKHFKILTFAFVVLGLSIIVSIFMFLYVDVTIIQKIICIIMMMLSSVYCLISFLQNRKYVE